MIIIIIIIIIITITIIIIIIIMMMMMMMIMIIITLFESQIILAEHECCTNLGETVNQINQIKCWFLRRGENWSSRRKTSELYVFYGGL